MLEFVAGTNKGGVKQGDLFNNPFRLGQITEERVNYTSAAVVESHTATAEEVTANYIEVRAMWTPVADVKKVLFDGTEYTIIKTGTPTTGQVLVEVSPTDAISIGFTFPAGVVVANKELKFSYLYDNVIIPQDDIPVLNARMQGIALEAKARRIAIYY